MSESFVYFIRQIGTQGPVKIGHSRVPQERLLHVALWSPVDLELWLTTPGSRKDEYNLHCALIETHRRQEWFSYSPALQAIYDQVSSGVRLADAIPEHSGLHPTHHAASNMNRRRTAAEREIHSVRSRARNASKRTGFSPPQSLTAAYEKWRGAKRSRSERMPPILIAEYERFIASPNVYGEPLDCDWAVRARANDQATA